MQHRHEHPEVARAMRPWNFIFFLIYAAQKTTNNAEGISKGSINRILKDPQSQGGFGLTPEKAGAFLTDTYLGWYIKALFGLLTDNLPLFGYRRKSWLIITSLLTGITWFWVAMNGTSLQALLVGLMIINIMVAFNDVVCDGLMVQTAQHFELQYKLPAGTVNRPFQAAMWSGAYVALFISSIAGAVIAQFFEMRMAAVISGIVPLVLAIAVAFLVREEKVAWDKERAKKGFIAIGVIIIVAFTILKLKDIPADNPVRPFEPIITAVIIITAMLLMVRIPKALLPPLILVFFWQAAPFDSGTSYMYQYFTLLNTQFVDALGNEGFMLDAMRTFVVWLGIVDQATLQGESFVELYWSGILRSINALFAIFGALFYRRYLQSVPFGHLFAWCILAQGAVMASFLMFSVGKVSDPGILMAIMAVEGAVFLIATLAIFGYAAKRTPNTNQASIFALFMGMYNLGQSMGRERVGGPIFTSFADKATITIDGVTETVLRNPDMGVTATVVISVAYLGLVYMLVRYMVHKGHIMTHPEDAKDAY
jgi:MFS family permease